MDKELKRLCESALNEGNGAAVTFNFDQEEYQKKYSGEPADFDIEGLTIKVKNLLITDSEENGKRAFDGGYITFKEDDIKKEAVRMYNKYDRLLDNPEITIDDVKTIDEINIESIPNLMYSFGWIRVELPEDTVLTWEKNMQTGYLPQLEVTMTLKNGEQITANTVNVDGKYYPSEEVVEVYNCLGEDDDFDMDESIEDIQAKTYQNMLDDIKTHTGTGMKIDTLKDGKYLLKPYRLGAIYKAKIVTDKDLLSLKDKNYEEQRDYLLDILRK